MKVKAKKHLGQHFLKNPEICQKIARALTFFEDNYNVLEIGPGTGALTTELLALDGIKLKVIDLDKESIEYLKKNESKLGENDIIFGDFLKSDFKEFYQDQICIVGNFPYNISSQILFKILEEKEFVPEMVGMFQKEVAERVCSKPGNKTYGILSVLIQAFYQTEYLFTVDEHEFIPPPKVKSGVMRMQRKAHFELGVDPVFYKKVIKLAFNQRRKTLRNSLKTILNDKKLDHSDPIFTKRPEQLGWEEFVYLSKLLS